MPTRRGRKRLIAFTPMSPSELVSHLSDGTLLVRTGVALVPPPKVAAYEMFALQWGAEAVDLAQLRLARAPEGSRYLGLGPDTLLADLDAIASGKRGPRCALIANADLLLARLSDGERPKVWDFLFSSLKKRPTALLLLMPDGAEHLFSSIEEERWSRAGRLCRLADNGTDAGTWDRRQEGCAGADR